jgi:outer membrane protein OmpA-like peptidoglycan-associated protein
MNMNRKWMILLLLILGAVITSGCSAPKDTIMMYNEAKEAFQKATIAGAKKCAPCQYGTAEANLALADHEMRYYWRELEDLFLHSKIAKEKSLEALKLTPCEKPAPPAPAPVPPAPAPPAPAPPPPPAPPKPAPTPAPPPKPVVFDTIYFDPNKTNITPIAAKALDKNGQILNGNPNIRVEIGGHTDGEQSAANQKISEKRAQSCKKYLMDKFNIPEKQMIIKGYGGTKPVADNKTQEGRSKNRRVEFKTIP